MGDCFSKEPLVSIDQKILMTDQRSEMQMITLPEILEYDENGRPKLRIKIPEDNVSYSSYISEISYRDEAGDSRHT